MIDPKASMKRRYASLKQPGFHGKMFTGDSIILGRETIKEKR